jgi:protocatechuate 3,4-dioxygenase beta subunit
MKTKLAFLATLSAFLLLILPAEAKQLEPKAIKNCTRTPWVKAQFQPKFTNDTNNLRRKTGSGFVAKGEPIYVSGRVLDENCFPIKDATVRIWQANSFGRYNHKKDKSDNFLDEHFLGHGATKTDNNGEFTFLTVFPGTNKKKSAPRVHFYVTAPGLKPLKTEMYFPEQPGNYSDTKLKKRKSLLDSLSAKTEFQTTDTKFRAETIEGDMVYYFSMVLRGTNKYRTY